MRDESGWGFVDGYGDADRVAMLMDHGTSFDQIVIRLVDGARVVCARWEWGRVGGELDGYVRVNLEILARGDAVDLFHNGRDGYRARYYEAKSRQAANRVCGGVHPARARTGACMELAEPWVSRGVDGLA
jgi:hypothetical protein